MDNTLILLSAILGSTVVSSILTLYFTRRKLAAEIDETNARTSSEKIDTTKKISDVLEQMQGKNVELYERNSELEKLKSDHENRIDALVKRLDLRDEQLTNCTKQMNLLSDLAKQSPITDTLRGQLDVVNGVVAELQSASTELRHMLAKKDEILKDLFDTNRDLRIKPK